MKEVIIRTFAHHRYGIKALRNIYHMDQALLCFTVFQAILEAVLPYIDLHFYSRIIDTLINTQYSKAIQFVFIIGSIKVAGNLVIDLLESINCYKSDKIHRAILRNINRKAMELDYEEMEDTGLLQKISDATYIMEHVGGYNVFINYYRRLFESVIKIVSSLFLVMQLCCTYPLTEHEIVFAYLISLPINSFIVFFLSIIISFILSNSITIWCKNNMRIGYQEKMKVERTLNYYADEVFMNHEMGKDIRLFNMLNLIEKKHSDALHKSIRFYNKYYDDAERDQESLQIFNQGLFILIAYFIVICKVLSGAISIGGLSKFIGSLTILGEAINLFLATNQKISLQTDFINTFQEFMEIKSKRNMDGIRIDQKGSGEFCIEFNNVSFRYRGSDTNVLQNISCKITSHSKVAIVGKNGAGKTTFIKLLCRLYEPTDGVITLNGINIKDYSYADYLDLFSVVFQDFNLFSFSIGENITVGQKNNEDQIYQCLELVGLAEQVRNMPNKLHTSLFKYEKDGYNISGGESQKIAIARALYKNSPFFILDEPTAALDPQSEYEVLSVFNQMIQEKGSISITHRMGNCKNCCEILVFDEGQIVQCGTHEQLIQENGIYQELFYAQANYYMDKEH